MMGRQEFDPTLTGLVIIICLLIVLITVVFLNGCVSYHRDVDVLMNPLITNQGNK